MGLRKLTLTSEEQKASGTSNNGPWTLWEVAAVDEAGEPVDAKLKTFGQPVLGQLIEYEIERQEDEKYGVSYLLSKPGGRNSGGGKGGGLKGSVDELRARVQKLEAQVAELARAAGIASGATQRSESPATGPDVGPAGDGQDDKERPYHF